MHAICSKYSGTEQYKEQSRSSHHESLAGGRRETRQTSECSILRKIYLSAVYLIIVERSEHTGLTQDRHGQLKWVSLPD